MVLRPDSYTVNKMRTSRERLWLPTRRPTRLAMRNLLEELREILRPTAELQTLTDAQAVEHIARLRAMQQPDQPPSQLIEGLEEAWRAAAAPDMRR